MQRTLTMNFYTFRWSRQCTWINTYRMFTLSLNKIWEKNWNRHGSPCSIRIKLYNIAKIFQKFRTTAVFLLLNGVVECNHFICNAFSNHNEKHIRSKNDAKEQYSSGDDTGKSCALCYPCNKIPERRFSIKRPPFTEKKLEQYWSNQLFFIRQYEPSWNE